MSKKRKGITHGMTGTRLYSVWSGMKTRCLNSRTAAFKNYGGRRISICNEWLSFENFYRDMGRAYEEGLFLERIDNDGNYSPENCKWATWHEQSRNKRTNRFVTYEGETKCLMDWAKKMAVHVETIRSRLRVKISPDRLFKKSTTLNKIQVQRIKLIKQINPKITLQQLADMFGVSNSTIYRTLNKESS